MNRMLVEVVGIRFLVILLLSLCLFFIIGIVSLFNNTQVFVVITFVVANVSL